MGMVMDIIRDDDPDLLDIPLLAERTGIDRQSWYRWCREGKIENHKFGRHVRVPKWAAKEFIDNGFRPVRP